MSKKITYYMTCKDNRSEETWLEKIEGGRRLNKPTTDEEALSVAEETVKIFNDTLHEHEIPRILVSVEKHITENLIVSK